MSFKAKIYQINAQRAGTELFFIDNPKPEISWQVESDSPDFCQSAYRINAVNDGGETVWDSGEVKSGCSRWVSWGGAALKSSEIITLQLQVADASGNWSEFSDPVRFVLGRQQSCQWGGAHWLAYAKHNNTTSSPLPYFRKEFTVKPGLKKAICSVTARGVFEASLDGAKIGNDFLAPGWTDFRIHVPFVSHEISDRLSAGKHALGVILGDGWCCGNLTVLRRRNFYHDHPEFLLSLQLFYEDGSVEYVVSDASWQVKTGALLSGDIYDGEFYDARYEMPGWDTAGFDASSWDPAQDCGEAGDTPELVQKTAPGVRVKAELKPVKILSPQKDVYIWDFGQNITGTFRVKLKGIPGRLYTFRTAEMLNDDGTLYTLNYRSALSCDHYICAGGEEFTEYMPRFTFHGFRYLQIEGFQFAEKIPAEDLDATAIVLYSDLEKSGDFECGDQLINRLYQNVVWGQRGNFLEIPTDCPQRDERLGWTGDSQLFAPMAVFNMECAAFYRKYLRDIREGMTPEGASPSIAPAILNISDGAAGWGDAIILIPYTLYKQYGWKGILEENYVAMTRSIAFQLANSTDFIRPGKHQFGDWLAVDKTPSEVVTTAYFAYCAGCLAEIAGVLGKEEDSEKYRKLSEDIKAAFNREFVGEDGLVKVRTQAAVIFALYFDLVEDVSGNSDLLEKLIRDNGTRISTGFLGTGLILKTLAKSGKSEVARDLLLQKEHPSWLFSVCQGATTIWERWDSYTLDRGFGDVSMNSFNHYAYGAAMEFLFRQIAGIGYSADRIVFSLDADARFSPVKASYDSPFGRVSSAWSTGADGQVDSWQVEVPFGISAEAVMADGTVKTLLPGVHSLI